MSHKRSLDAFRRQDSGWQALEFFSNSAEAIAAALDEKASSGANVLPEPENVYRAFATTPFAEVNVAIIGQDPYPQVGNADGLAFSVPDGRRLPASLRNIFKAYSNDLHLPFPRSGNLVRWGRNGVLLLNSALTVEENLSGSHARLGWSELIDQALRKLSREKDHLVFMAWGRKAELLLKNIDTAGHLIVRAPHPSPLAGARLGAGQLHPFIASQPFLKAEAWRKEMGLPPVRWDLG